MGKKARRHRQMVDATRRSKLNEMSFDPNISLEDFLSMAGVLPPALILDTWGNAIEDPDVIDRCRRTLEDHILDTPKWLFAALSQTRPVIEIRRMLGEVVDGINRNLNLVVDETEMRDNMIVHNKELDVEDAMITFNFYKDESSYDEIKVKNVEMSILWPAQVTNPEEDYIAGFGRRLHVKVQKLQEEPWQSASIDETEVIHGIINRPSGSLRSLGFRNQIPVELLRMTENDVAYLYIKGKEWQSRSCHIGRGVEGMKLNPSAISWNGRWSMMEYGYLTPGERYSQRANKGNMQPLAFSGFLPSDDKRESNMANRRSDFGWTIPGLADLGRSEAYSELCEVMKQFLNGNSEPMRELLRPLTDRMFINRPSLAFTPDGSEIDTDGLGYQDMIYQLLTKEDVLEVVMAVDVATRKYDIPRLDWWGIIEKQPLIPPSYSYNPSSEYLHSCPLAQSTWVHDGLVNLIDNLSPYPVYTDYGWIGTKSAWLGLPNEQIPLLVKMLQEELGHYFEELDDLTPHELERIAEIKTRFIRSWRHSTGDAREGPSWPLGRIVVNIATGEMLSVELHHGDS